MKEEKKPKVSKKESELPKGRKNGDSAAIPGINTPGIELPAFNPPVPNRAWTAMKNGKDIDELSAEEKRNLYLGRDDFI